MSTSQSLKMPVSRRRFLRGATLAAAAVSSGSWPGVARSQEKDEIVIGFQNDQTGVLASFG